MKKIASKIRIEEHFLFIISFLMFSVYFLFFHSQSPWLESAKKEFHNLKAGMSYFNVTFYFFIFLILLRLIFWITNKLVKVIEKKQGIKSNEKRYLSLRKKIIGFFPMVRLFAGIALFFGALIGILGYWANALKDRLVNNELNGLDHYIFGNYPFLWLQSTDNLFRKFDGIILYCFGLISVFISLAFIIFYLAKNRKFLSMYIISISLAVLISLPIWYLLPSNSPQNAFIKNVYGKELKEDIKESVVGYRPTNVVSEFQDKINNQQKTTPPISTMPSMHVAWAIIIAYLTFKLNKKLSLIFIPWAIFSTIGTVYLAQHYFIDIIVSIPIAVISLEIAKKLVRFEKKYYHNPQQDNNEVSAKENIVKYINKLLIPFRVLPSIIINRKLSDEDNAKLLTFFE